LGVFGGVKAGGEPGAVIVPWGGVIG
jgi:hypothetical protein